MSRNVWILCCFLLFNLSVLIYAIIYFKTYRRSPGSFLFAAHLYQTRTAEFLATTERLLSRLKLEVAALTACKAQLTEDSNRPPLGVDRPLPGDFNWRLVRRAFVGIGGGAAWGIFIEVIDPNGTLIAAIDIGQSGHLRFVNRQLGRRTRKQQLYERRRDSTSSDVPDIWSFTDLLYFSFITQSMVGYGDILPNRTVIRVLVASQIWVSYAILILLINLAFL